MRTGRPIAALSLEIEERESLENWARRPTSAQALAQRARIVLECAAGDPNLAVARKLRITPQTVGKWRQRFLERRLDGLLDEPRPGAPRQVVMRRLSAWCGSPWKAPRPMQLTGVRSRWPSAAA
jgi:hypothetical protein